MADWYLVNLDFCQNIPSNYIELTEDKALADPGRRTLITAHQGSYGKVMFSNVSVHQSVIQSVEKYPCTGPYHPHPFCARLWTHLTLEGVYIRVGLPIGAGADAPELEKWQYTSYWNAFLF